jgi:hypothetical protein
MLGVIIMWRFCSPSRNREPSMRRHCAHCGSDKFGLIRRGLGSLQFCTLKCKEAWQAQQRRHLYAQKRWITYLARAR